MKTVEVKATTKVMAYTSLEGVITGGSLKGHLFDRHAFSLFKTQISIR
jgi:hypothetical protein